MHSWGKFWTKDTKRPKKPQLPLLKSQEQKQGVGDKSRALRMPPAINTTKAGGRQPKPRLQPDPPPAHPYPHPI